MQPGVDRDGDGLSGERSVASFRGSKVEFRSLGGLLGERTRGDGGHEEGNIGKVDKNV
jgi:hypothetical protein